MECRWRKASFPSGVGGGSLAIKKVKKRKKDDMIENNIMLLTNTDTDTEVSCIG